MGSRPFVTAFMLAELKGDADAVAALAPDSVNFPGIEYETSEFGVEQAALDPALVSEIEAQGE